MSLSSIIGQASRGADLYFVFRFLRLLTMDYKKTDAYKFKIIDSKGNALKKSADLESTKEKAAYTMLHRLVFKIRRLMEKIPGGRFISYAAALFLLKEQKDVRIWTDDIYMKTKLMEFLETDWEADAKFLKEEVDNMDKKSFKSFLSENKTIEESQELQAMMALDDAGIEAVIDKKGKIVINKKDKKRILVTYDLEKSDYLLSNHMQRIRNKTKKYLINYNKFYEISVNNHIINTVYKRK